MITREIVCIAGEPIWRVCSGGYCVECRSGTQAAAVMEALEATAGMGLTHHDSFGPPRVGPDMIPDPGV